MRTIRHLLLLSLTLAGATVAGATVAGASGTTVKAQADAGAPHVRVLSTRSDLISGGNVLVAVTPAGNQTLADLSLELNGADVSGVFSPLGDGRLLGLVSGLELGENTFVARAGAAARTVTLTNHPGGGPVVSGPQLEPWTCQAGAVDADCNQPAQFRFHYLPEEGTELQAYDPANPADDVAMVTTETGQTVPFIVREETGYIDRDQYRIAVLFDPAQDWSAIAPQPQFNGKLMITHGASCGVDYRPQGAPSVLRYNPLEFAGDFPVSPGDDNVVYALGRGFAVMSNALNNSGHNCNLPLQAESMIMTKEHVVEQYGELRYTIGVGCSGGALAMQWMANAYPGIYQGILPTCSFPDAWGTATQFADYHLLLDYFFEKQGGFHVEPKHPDWTLPQIAEVMGHLTFINAEISETAQFHVAVAADDNGCGGVSGDQLYHPETNPDGVRCAIQDAAINIFGPRDASLWTAPEQAIGRGFAGFPIDNVGVQFGLSALQRGIITPEQFIELNRDIGGLDIDANPTAERFAADESTLVNAYRSGMINSANNLNQTAIIDCRGPDPGLFHDAYRTFALRARLDREHGNHDNHVIWGGPVPLIADSNCHHNSLLAMDEWLAEVEQDDSPIPLADKLTANRPADLTDMCWDGTGTAAAPVLCPETVLTVYGTPRMVAGDAITTDTNKCQLKPISADDYLPHVGLPYAAGTPAPDVALPLVPLLSDAQLAELETIFPDGTCDFSVPGVGQQGTVPWQTYQDQLGDVIYGGIGLARTTDGSGAGWMHPNFGGVHAAAAADTDGDGVQDSVDACPATSAEEADSVDANGCGPSERDSDDDGVSDSADQCPDTAAGQAVDSRGCASASGELSVELTATPAQGDVTNGPVTVTLSAQASVGDASLSGELTYVYYFGDGSNSGETSAAEMNHDYDRAGRYQPTVVVRDENSNSASDSTEVRMTTTVTVEGDGGTMTAALTIVTDGSVAPVTATFDASGTQNAPEGAIYSFDFGDGSTRSSTNPIVVHVYTLPGSYPVSMTVSDPEDAQNSATAAGSVTVTAAEQTTAIFTVSPATATVDVTPVRFDASASIAAPGSQIQSYRFDFYGDGSEVREQAEPETTFVYARTGAFEPTVTVTDSENREATSKAAVQVEAPAVAPPTAGDDPQARDNGGSGALGWMALLLGLAGLRRRAV